MLAITYTKITKIKVAEWGTPKKYLIKKKLTVGISSSQKDKRRNERNLKSTEELENTKIGEKIEQYKINKNTKVGLKLTQLP